MTDFEPQPNVIPIPLPGGDSNIVPAGGGSVVKGGFLSSPNFKTGIAGWSIDADGNAEFNDIFIRGYVKTVSVGDDIQSVINLLNTFGGGEVRLDVGTFTLTSHLTLYAGVHLVGAGRDLTILEFSGGAFGVKVIGTTSTYLSNFKVKDLTIQNSNHTAGLDIQYASFFQLDNIEVSSCDQKGISIKYSIQFSVSNSEASTNTGDNWYFASDNITNGHMRFFSVIQCSGNSGGVAGFHFENISGAVLGIRDYIVLGCTATGNTGDGFLWDGTGGSSSGINGYAQIFGCRASSNDGYGFNLVTGTAMIFIGGDVGSDNIQVTPFGNYFIANIYNTLTDVSLPTTEGRQNFFSDILNSKLSQATPVVVDMYNDSGGTLTAGTVVIYKPEALQSGTYEMTTTTTGGDDKVAGVVVASTANVTRGRVQVAGTITTLKVDGTTDIAIGDFLTTHTVAGIAAKAAAGDQVFAIAYEAYSTNDSSGVIDCLLISPRMI